jgi:hypothetical protein
LVTVLPSFAATYSAQGAVDVFHSSDTERDANDWFTLVGVRSLGSCKAGDAGLVSLALPYDERMFQRVLAAQTTGAPVTVWVDDNVTAANGFCVVQSME